MPAWIIAKLPNFEHKSFHWTQQFIPYSQGLCDFSEQTGCILANLVETKPHKPALLRNYLVTLLRDFFPHLSKNQHKEKDPFESLIKYCKKLK